jgi:endonuclease YncB( thermonuclease family)
MGAYSNSSYSADEVEERPKSVQAVYLTGLPKTLLGAAVAPMTVPAPVRMNATVVGHWDGDSFYVKLPLGVYGLMVEKQLIRVIGCAARERGEEGGIPAREALKVRPGMTVGSPVVLTAILPSQTSLQNDKFGGRLDAVVTYLAADGIPHDLGSDLIAEQWAVPWNGVGVQPKPPWPRTVP